MRFPRGLKNVNELNAPDFNGLSYEGTVSAGEMERIDPILANLIVIKLLRMENTYLFFDGNGDIIYDISAKRVKAFKINKVLDGTTHFGDYKLKGSVPQFLLDLFAL